MTEQMLLLLNRKCAFPGCRQVRANRKMAAQTRFCFRKLASARAEAGMTRATARRCAVARNKVIVPEFVWLNSRRTPLTINTGNSLMRKKPSLRCLVETLSILQMAICSIELSGKTRISTLFASKCPGCPCSRTMQKKETGQGGAQGEQATEQTNDRLPQRLKPAFGNAQSQVVHSC